MEKLELYVCENIYPEYKFVIDRESFTDVELIKLPSICDKKSNKQIAKEKLKNATMKNSMLVCSSTCGFANLIQDGVNLELIATNYCFGHLVCSEFLDYLIAQRSYIVSSGWLKEWKRHIQDMGFDKETARMFFKETSKQVVFLDAGIIENAEETLQELSSYLGIPYQIVPVKLNSISIMLRSKVNEWRLRKQEEINQVRINELRSQSAEYSAVFDMLGKISTFTSKRAIIGKIKDLFIMVFGAQDFKFWDSSVEALTSEMVKFKTSKDEYLLFDKKFWIKISWNEDYYGVLDVGNFIFSKYITKYLNLALEVAKFCGLVLHNNEQYQKVVESESKLKYLSYHDSMTNLYNRAYINEIMNNKAAYGTIVFMFDVDKLKYVNDSYGHAEGDRLLKRFAKILDKSFRDEQDIVARVGGDEFVAIIQASDEKAAQVVSRRITELIEMDNQQTENKGLELSTSIGYVANNKDYTIEDLIKIADEKMYENKMRKKQDKA